MVSMEKGDVAVDDGGKSIDGEAGSQELYIDPKREARLTRKLDLWIAPVMTVSWFLGDLHYIQVDAYRL